MAEPFTGGYRWATITPDDHSGVLYITAFLTFTYANLTFITRCFLKYQVFGLDDWTLVIAQVCMLRSPRSNLVLGY